MALRYKSALAFSCLILLLATFYFAQPIFLQAATSHETTGVQEETGAQARTEKQGAMWSADEIEKMTGRLKTQLQKLHEDGNFPGGTFSIVLADGQCISAACGMSDVENSQEMQIEDRMMSASIGKTYFAAIAIDLITQKKLSLEDSVSNYLGEKEWYSKIPNSDQLTVGNLMRHQSGIPRYVFDRKLWEAIIDDPNKTWEPAERLEFIFEKDALHPAGEGWAYSDTNYILLGMIIEQLIDQPAYDYIAEHFLEPNDLKNTFPNNKREMKGLIQGYNQMFQSIGLPEKMIDDGKFVFNPQMEWCGGGFYSSSSDLAKWAKIYFSGNAIEAEYLKIMTEHAADSSAMLGPNSRYGLAVMIRPSELGEALGHDGGFPGYTSTTGYFPDKNISAAFMINTDAPQALPKPIYQVMFDIVAEVIE